MAAVLKFPLERVTRSSKRNSSEKEAKILLFEGVRYGSKEAQRKIEKA